jgi:hypothetical protein
MSISQRSGNSVPIDNLVLSLVSTVFICFLFFLFAKYIPIFDAFFSMNALLIACFALTFSWTRSFSLYWANTQQMDELVYSRILRSISLFCLGCAFLYFEIRGYSLAVSFQIIALCAGLLFTRKYLPLLARINIFLNISLENLKSCTVRTISLGVDMLHIPLCLLAMNRAIELNLEDKNIEVYILGLGLPAVAIICQVLNEYFRGRVGSILEWFEDRQVIRQVTVVLLVSAILFCLSYIIYIADSFYFVFSFFIIGKLLSSLSGLLVYKLDYERYDLGINVLITCVISIGFFSEYLGSWFLVNVILAAVAIKYVLTTAIVLVKIREI